MKKCFLLFLLVFFLSGAEILYAQTGNDSAGITEENNPRDTLSGDEPETLVINPYSLYRVKVRSGFVPGDTLRQVSRNQIRSYTLNPDYAYANDPAYWTKQQPLKISPALTWIFLSSMLVLILFGIYKLVRENSFSWFSRKSSISYSGLQENPVEENTDYEAMILLYQTQGNFRMAIRFMYLRLLQTAGSKSGIHIRDSSTNAEIALAFANHPIAPEFRFLSRAYEYVFYGGFTPQKELFDSLKNRFEDFQKTFSS